MTPEGSCSVREAPPKAGAMIEALRGIGYSTATALADIIDNSISANSKTIDVFFIWNGIDSRIEILDDGAGMSMTELEQAMRLGDKNPLEIRDENDLGRFGLGLKTSSFSQCKRLTVASRKNNITSCLNWDLDVIANDPEDRWLLLDGASTLMKDSIEKKINLQSTGTLVGWEILDRIITSKFTEQDFLDLIDSVEAHLAMIFHRFLDGSYGRIEIKINNVHIKPWDPFMEGNPAKPWHAPAIKHPLDSRIEVECHVLPHKDRISEEEYINYQGPDGWTAQQGFYVYRGGRMLVHGSWLGLGKGRPWTKDEAHRLARIRLDIPTSSDIEWKIDIKKATARPPVKYRDWLIQIAELTRNRARRTFAHRGRLSIADNNDKTIVPAWLATKNSEGIQYKINYDHPAIKLVLDNSGQLLSAVKSMINVIQETVPIQRIWLDTEEQRDTPRNRFLNEPPQQLESVLTELFLAMTKHQGMTPMMAVEQLKKTEPFNDYPEIVDGLLINKNGVHES